MFALVQFRGSESLDICQYDSIKNPTTFTGFYTIRWKGAIYEAKVLLVHEYKVIKSYHENMKKGLPIVVLECIKGWYKRLYML